MGRPKPARLWSAAVAGSIVAGLAAGASAVAPAASPAPAPAVVGAIPDALEQPGAARALRVAQIKREQLTPKGHFKIERPANLSPAEALAIYGNIADDLARGYAASRDVTAENFRKWRQYNSAPYRSATHGNRYINNYANAKASRYGTLKPGEQMPPGALLAKDSFTVSANGDVYGGPLFIMEKLGKGVSPETGDWRYVMIMPDGSYFGDSTGDGAERVTFCNGCHRAAASDYMFLIPAKYRKQFFGGQGLKN